MLFGKRQKFNLSKALLGSRKRLLCPYLLKDSPGVVKKKTNVLDIFYTDKKCSLNKVGLQKIWTREPPMGSGIYISLIVMSGSFVHIFWRCYLKFIFIKHFCPYKRYLDLCFLLKNVKCLYNEIWTKEPFLFKLRLPNFDLKYTIRVYTVPAGVIGRSYLSLKSPTVPWNN